jgi:hypothetical protein
MKTSTKWPPGWYIGFDPASKEIVISAPKCDPGAITLTGNERPLATRLLYAMAIGLLHDQVKSVKPPKATP